MLLTFLAAVTFAVLNRMRGTYNFLVWAPAFALALFVEYSVPGNYVALLVMAGAFVLGENWGWTKYIHCIPGQFTQEEYNARWLDDDTGRYNGVHWLASLFIDETKNYQDHCWLAMILRGLWWWVPVFAVLVWYGLVSIVAAVVVAVFLSLIFPVVYRIAYNLPEILSQGYIRRAEWIYGFLYGGVLGYLLLV